MYDIVETMAKSFQSYETMIQKIKDSVFADISQYKRGNRL